LIILLSLILSAGVIPNWHLVIIKSFHGPKIVFMFACGYVESVNFSLFMITSPAGSCFEKGGISPNF